MDKNEKSDSTTNEIWLLFQTDNSQSSGTGMLLLSNVIKLLSNITFIRSIYPKKSKNL